MEDFSQMEFDFEHSQK